MIPHAIEELQRYESFTYVARLVTEETTPNGQQLQPGHRVQLLAGATGRDPRLYDDPETVDLDRMPTRHLALGLGAHRCLGIHLAPQVDADRARGKGRPDPRLLASSRQCHRPPTRSRSGREPIGARDRRPA